MAGRSREPGDNDDAQAALARQFERFAALECGESPLYRRLAGGVARDRDLLRLAAPGDRGPKPNLFLGAVHYLLLGGVQHPLASFYPSLTANPAPPAGADRAFRAFCLDHAQAIRDLMATRRVQTNEVARCTVLLPGFTFIAERAGSSSLLLVEVGASAGLLLHWERYRYNYGGRWRHGPESGVLLRCELRGSNRPPLPAALPTVQARTGIDLYPVNLEEEDHVLWLRALVWPDQPERADRLRQAVAVARQHPVRLVAGDVLAVLPDVLSGLSSDGYLCLFHAHTLNQLPPVDR